MQKDFAPLDDEKSRPPDLKEVESPSQSIDQESTLINPELREQAISQEADPLLGSILGGTINIQELIGKGGMSTVYRGWHEQIERPVAVKVMHSHLIEEKNSLLRFQKEAKAVGKLDHPNIVKVNDFRAGEQGLSYLVMDYVQGRDLSSLIDEEGVLSLERAVNIFSQAIDALEHAHKNGIVHRDIKPSNLMIVDDEAGEQVKILDFGIAKVVQEDLNREQRLTKTGEVFGSPLYMSPEQCMGKELDHRSDIYSMGCLIYEAFTKIPPLEGANVFETFFKHTTEMPEPLSNLRPDLPRGRELDGIIFKAMAKEPEKRYPSMKELKDDLQRLVLTEDQTDTGLLTRVYNEIEYLKRRGSAGGARQLQSRLPLILGACALMVAALALITAPNLVGGINAGGEKLTWTEAYIKGQEAFDTGQYDTAKSDFEQALKIGAGDRTREIPVLRELLDLMRAQGESGEVYEKKLTAYRNEDFESVRLELNNLGNRLDAVLKSDKPLPLKQEEIENIAHEINENANNIVELFPERRELAEKYLTELLSSLDTARLTESRARVRTIHNLGFIAYTKKDLSKSNTLLARALAYERKAFKTDPSIRNTYLNTLDTYFHSLMESGNSKEAKKVLEERLTVARSLLALESVGKLKSSVYLAKSKFEQALFAFFEEGDSVRARALARSSLRLYDNMPEPPVLERANCLSLLGRIDLSEKNYLEAGENLTAAKVLYEKLSFRDSPYFVETLIGLGEVMERSSAAKAEPYYRRAVVVGLRQIPQYTAGVEKALGRLEAIIKSRHNATLAGTRLESPELFDRLFSLENLKLDSDRRMHGQNSEIVLQDYQRLYELSRFHTDLTRADQYLARQEELIKAMKGNADRYFDLLIDRANLEFDRKDREAARAYLERALTLAQDNTEALAARGDLIKKFEFSAVQRLKDEKLAESVRTLFKGKGGIEKNP
ncbi:MAG: serine/threonine protein kinase [Candidatus Obscuribacterales bacterium]|nr:serine/threonine protein kinase [Candidatus Obscuribacterales bacterium]